MDKDKKVDILFIPEEEKISTALQQMDSINRKLLIVTEKGAFKSLLSIGDIQRAIIKGIALDTEVKHILRSQISVATESDSLANIKKGMLSERSEFMPVLSEAGELIKVIFWEDLFGTDITPKKSQLGLPVVIMAGGIGSRLRPLTNVLPKALIPIGDKSIIEQIMDTFVEYGCKEYYLSVNHKAEMIKYYFSSLTDTYGRIEYVEEDDFLGTAGSIGLLKGMIDKTFFVSNCDILVDQDYAEVLEYHKVNDNEITIVAAMLNINVPYGLLNTNRNGHLESISEKPEMFFKINTGLYVLEPSVFDDIPTGEVYHITELIEKLIDQERKIGVFPVSEKSWTDMGNWDEFLKQAKVR